MAIFSIRIYIRATIADHSAEDHYVVVLVRADDEQSGVATATERGLLAGLVAPVVTDVTIEEVRVYETTPITPEAQILMAARDAACLFVG